MLSNAVMVSSLKGPVLVPSSFLNLFCIVNHCQFLETFSSLVSLTLCLIFLPLSALLTTTFLLLAVHYFLHLLLKMILWTTKNNMKMHASFMLHTQDRFHPWCPHPKRGLQRADIWKLRFVAALYVSGRV